MRSGFGSTWREPVPDVAVALSADTLDAILGNVLNNAREHAGADAHITVGAERRGDLLEIQIADNGPGVSPANATRIFEPFFTTARNKGGTGLGLSVAKALLEAHGGSIELLSALAWRPFRNPPAAGPVSSEPLTILPRPELHLLEGQMQILLPISTPMQRRIEHFS
ncbi:MAG: ATP-binding protein [Chromatiales bacterium]|nr:ATP-binding protein [Chromatiales bacterium]